MDKTFQEFFNKENYEKRKISVLKDINLIVSKGESLGILGLNGSGKSTLLQVIAGTYQLPKEGTKCDGKVAAILELGSGFNQILLEEKIFIYVRQFTVYQIQK